MMAAATISASYDRWIDNVIPKKSLKLINTSRRRSYRYCYRYRSIGWWDRFTVDNFAKSHGYPQDDHPQGIDLGLL